MKFCSVFVLLSLVSLAMSWYPLHKRQQEDVMTQGGMCSRETYIERICTDGFYEEYTTVAAQCNQSQLARTVGDTCRSNEAGVRCGGIDMDADYQQFFSACESSLTAGTNCSENCSSHLAARRTQYGCCTAVFNNSFFISDEERAAYSYSLWSRCGLEPVPEECAPAFRLPAVDPTCTPEAFRDRLTFSVVCRSQFLRDLRDYAVSCGDDSGDDGNSSCAVDERGSYCSLQDDMLYSANSEASANCPNTTACDPLCTETLSNITRTYGCCFVSKFNTTAGSQRDYLSYEFWQRCGLTSPGLCRLRLDDSPWPSRTSAADASVLAVLLAMAMTFALYQ